MLTGFPLSLIVSITIKIVSTMAGKIVREQYVGKSFTNLKGQEYTVIGYPPKEYAFLFVRFKESGHEYKRRMCYVLSGNILDHENTKSLDGEIWKNVVGFEGLYMVSNYGRVKSLPNQYRDSELILRQRLVKRYYSVPLHDREHKIHNVRVHRLVAMAFIPNPNNYDQINHKDENRLNNHVDNLEWCDAKYNINYGTALKRMSATRKSRMSTYIMPKRDKPVEMLTLDGILIKRFDSIKQAALETGSHRANIIAVCRKRDNRQQTNGYKWRYAEKK